MNTPKLARYTGQSADNAAVTVTANPATRFRLLWYAFAYSGAPTHGGVTARFDSGDGAAFDVTETGAANAQQALEGPGAAGASKMVGAIFRSADNFVVTAPAGGAGITSAVTIEVEILEPA